MSEESGVQERKPDGWLLELEPGLYMGERGGLPVFTDRATADFRIATKREDEGWSQARLVPVYIGSAHRQPEELREAAQEAVDAPVEKTCRHGKRIGWDCGLCELQGPDRPVQTPDALRELAREVWVAGMSYMGDGNGFMKTDFADWWRTEGVRWSQQVTAEPPAQKEAPQSQRWACLPCSEAAGTADSLDSSEHVSHAIGEACPRNAASEGL